jgi:glutamyl-tRNA synthetase
MKSSPEQLAGLVVPFLVKESVIKEGQSIDKTWLAKAVSTLQERSKTLVELAQSLTYYTVDEIEYNVKAKEKFLNEKYLPQLIDVKESIERLEVFAAAGIEDVFTAISRKRDIKLGNIAQPVRVAVTGRTESPGIFEVLEILGKEKTIRRLSRAIDAVKTKQ